MSQDSVDHQQVKYDQYCEYIQHIVLNCMDLSKSENGSPMRIELTFGDKATIKIWDGFLELFPSWKVPQTDYPLAYPTGVPLSPDINIIKYLVNCCPANRGPMSHAYHREVKYKKNKRTASPAIQTTIRWTAAHLPMTLRMIATRLDSRRTSIEPYNAIIGLNQFDHEQSIRNEVLMGLFFEPFKREVRRWASQNKETLLSFRDLNNKGNLRIQRVDWYPGCIESDYPDKVEYLDWLACLFPCDRVSLVQNKSHREQVACFIQGIKHKPVCLYENDFEEFVEERRLARVKKTDETAKLCLITREFRKLFVLYDILASSPIHEHDRIKALRINLGVDAGYDDDGNILMMGAKIVLLMKGIF